MTLSVEEVVIRFEDHPDLTSAVIEADGTPVGIISRNRLQQIYATRYGRDLNGRKPIAGLMESNPMIVDQDTPLERLGSRITDQFDNLPDNDFIIVDPDNRCVGVCTFMDLFKAITRLQIRLARYANPLTQLPGNVPLQEHIDALLAGYGQFAIAYCDLDNFKAFNDIYGYARGDDAIRLASRLLLQAVDPEQDFVGHIGGDDFMVVFRSRDWVERCHSLLEQFELKVPRLYDLEHRRQGGLRSRDRRGRLRFFPFLSISIGALAVEPGFCCSHHELSEMAAEVKRQAKRTQGNTLFIDRRTHNGVEREAGNCAAAVLRAAGNKGASLLQLATGTERCNG